MFSRFFSRITGRGCGSFASTPLRRRRPAQQLAAAAGQAMDALESRVLLSTLYVDASAPGPTYNGSSWTTAYKDLQLALSASVSGDDIRIADGTYKPTSTTERTISFALRDGVAIYGGYAGYGASNPGGRDIALYPTVLSGDIGTAGNNTDNSYHVLTATGVGASAVLDGITITGGYANGPYALNHSSGGGLLLTAGSPTLTNCTFSGNAASAYGGGMYNFGSSPALINCTFGRNSANEGGGIYNSSSLPTLTDCTFSGNSAGYSGGGMHNSSSSPTLTDCTFSGNSAGYFGGGMHNSFSSPALTSCTLSGNLASSNGGGMYNASSSSPTLTNCTFSGNSATGTNSSGGGMSNNASSSPTLANCTFRGNTATGNGGGMYNSSSSPTLVNCAFSSNSASGTSITSGGGGMLNASASPMLINCTFSGNSARSNGGGIHNQSSSAPSLINCTLSGNSASAASGLYNSSSSPRLTNCIVWGNANGAIIDSGSGMPVVTYSNIQGGYFGVGNINADPLFVRSPWTGPDGIFGTADDDPGDLRLREGSPALDAGSNAAVSGISTDAAGNVRIQNGTVDQGACEGPAAAPAPKTLYVDIGAISGANTGVSWANAFISLQSALVAASDGDTIRIADGTYRPTSTTDRSLGFSLRNAVAVYGGCAGYAASNPDARDITLYPTILSGDIGTAGIWADNSYHVLTATGVGPSTVLDGVAVTGGNANGSGSQQSYGGGLYATSASPTLVNCTFSGNSATVGAGMYNSASSPKLTNCTFSGNSAIGSYSSGGGMHNTTFSSPVLINCTFSGNSVTGSYSYGGGGMANYASSSPMLVNCTFSSNSGSSGGGMYNHSSSPTLINCTFSANLAGSSGGIYNFSASSRLTNCIVWGNTNGSISNANKGAVMVAYSNIQGGYTGTGNINADPLFVRNPSPGLDGLWNGIDDDEGDLRLQPGSPCIDRGYNVATGLAGSTDLAGKPRFVDVALTPDAGAGTPPIVDMGAYEAQWACPAWLDPAALAVWDAGDYSLDIGSGVLTVAADDGNRSERLEAIQQAIALGRSTGAGIVSSTAAEDRGVIAAVDAEGNILVRVALLGDVTLDERIDGDDYFAMDLAFLAGGGLRPEADVNVDGVVDGRDYLMLDRGFLRSAAGGVQQAGVPVEHAAQQPAARVFSVRSIAEELLIAEEAVLA